MISEKVFFKLMNNAAFGKTMKTVGKYRNVNLASTEARIFFFWKFITNRNGKNKLYMNKPVYLPVYSLKLTSCSLLTGLSTIEQSKIVMYEFWYDYIKPKYGGKAKLCFMDTDSFIVYVKTNDIYKDIAEDVERSWNNMKDYFHEKKIMKKPIVTW